MEDFNAHKWFKKQYLEEGMSDEQIQAIRRYEDLSADDKLKLAKIQKMMDREREMRDYYKGDSGVFPADLKEDNLNEINRDTFSMMEGMVNPETYKRFIDSLDNLLDDWYMEGFEKRDVVAFMEIIIPSN